MNISRTYNPISGQPKFWSIFDQPHQMKKTLSQEYIEKNDRRLKQKTPEASSLCSRPEKQWLIVWVWDMKKSGSATDQLSTFHQDSSQ